MGSLHFSPASIEQAYAVQQFPKSDIMIITGIAGSGKTHLGLYLGLKAIQDQRATKLILTRPTVPVDGEELGFLPGKLDQKMAPWLLPISDCLASMSWLKPDEFFKNHCEVVPLAFMRGRTFSKCVAILDEAQNCSYSQIRLFLTRLGQKGKLIICGDSAQSDRPDSGLERILDRLGFGTVQPTPGSFQALKGISHVELPSTSSPRHPLIPEIIRRLT
jgi:phosphate starvation-inducible protein PhoH and related proteins